MNTIRIPKEMLDKVSAICEHYDCEIVKGSRYDNYITVQSEDATNFFWLGANINNSNFNQ